MGLTEDDQDPGVGVHNRQVSLDERFVALPDIVAHLVESRARWLAWLDAFALAIAVPAGLAVAFGQGVGGGVAMIMGVLTGTFGGLMRDVVANEVPMVLRQGELYVTAAAAGAFVAVLAAPYLPTPTVLILAGCVTFALRAGSLHFGWSLPVYKSRPPR